MIDIIHALEELIVIYKNAPGRHDQRTHGRTVESVVSEPERRWGGASHGRRLLVKLTKFYRAEEKGLSHDDDELFDIGNDLADLLESEGSSSNAWKYGEEEFDPFVKELRTKPTVVGIDTAVNVIHQSLLNAALISEDEEAAFHVSEDMREFLLNRDNPKWIQEQIDYGEEMRETSDFDTMDWEEAPSPDNGTEYELGA